MGESETWVRVHFLRKSFRCHAQIPVELSIDSDKA